MSSLPKVMKCDEAGRSLNIAVIYSRIPFPMMRGDQMTVAHLLGFLHQRGHEVDFYTQDLDGAMDPEQAAWLSDACANVHVYRQRATTRAWGLFRGLFSLLPLQIGLFYNRKMKKDIRSAVDSGRYDIVYCYYPRSAPTVAHVKGSRSRARSFLALQLSQTLNTRRMASHESNVLKRIVFSVEARLMGRFESRIWQRFDRVVLIGPADVEAVRAECVRRSQPEIDNWVYGAHGTDTDRFQPATADEIVPNRIIFSGSMLYPPNVQAVMWFVERVWPRILASVPEATLVIQGRDPVAKIKALDGIDNIWVTGTVPDVGELIRSAQVCINPMLAAGGMQNKLIEYMACGKAVVSSSVANEGIRAPADTLLIADEPQTFEEAVISLLGDRQAGIELGAAARTYVLQEWTWEKHFLDLEKAFFESLDGPTSVEAT